MKLQIVQLKSGLIYTLSIVRPDGSIIEEGEYELKNWTVDRNHLYLVEGASTQNGKTLVHNLSHITGIVSPGQGDWRDTALPETWVVSPTPNFIPKYLQRIILAERRAGQFHVYSIWDIRSSKLKGKNKKQMRRALLDSRISRRQFYKNEMESWQDNEDDWLMERDDAWFDDDFWDKKVDLLSDEEVFDDQDREELMESFLSAMEKIHGHR